MSKRLFGSIIVLFLFFIDFYSENNNQKELSIKPETSKLLNRAELAITNPDEFFDGKKANKNDIILPVINIRDSKDEIINDGNEFRYSPSSIQSFSINKISVPIPQKTIIKEYKSDDKTVIDKALGILRSYSLSGVYSKDIKIEWKDLKDTDYAQTKPDKWALGLFGTRHIELNTKYKDVLNTPEYLAIILAHELSHQYDFDLLNANGSTLNNWAYNYITEEKAYQVQLYIYEKLLKEKPYLFDEDKIPYEKIKIFIEINKFLKAIWDYKNNNGKLPDIDNFPELKKVKAFNGKFKNMIDSLKDDKNFIGPYTFHSFVTLGYYKNYPNEGELNPEDAKNRLKEANSELKKKLKDNEIMSKFISVRNSLISDVYLPYCGAIGAKPPSNYLNMPLEISPEQSNQGLGSSNDYHDAPSDNSSNNNSGGNQYPSNGGEIGINPGPPPTPPVSPPNVDWGGSGGHRGS